MRPDRSRANACAFGPYPASWHGDCTFWRRRHAADREQLMSTFDNPFDPDRRLRCNACSCGRHVSQAEHEVAAQLQIQASLESEQKRYEGVVASAVMRAMFPRDAARRAFLKSVGAATTVAALSQFFPL